jgi:hypothetical protein
MNQPPHVLYVAWQDPDSRRILPVARVITSGSDGYEFAYIQAVDEARGHGFLPLLTFPDLQKVYRSRELMPLLQNRLLQNGRPDYVDYLSQLGLTPEVAEPFAVLARSGGRRATDKLELFSPPIKDARGRLVCTVLARGVRHMPGAEEAIARLEPGARLEVTVDPTNPFNPKAMKLEHGHAVLGFLPDYLASELSCDASELEVIVGKVNLPPAPVHHRLLLEVSLPGTDPPPFSGRKYQPLSSEASSLAA